MVTQKQGRLLGFVGIVLCLVMAGLMFFGAWLLPIRLVMLIVGIALITISARAKKSYNSSVEKKERK